MYIARVAVWWAGGLSERVKSWCHGLL